MSSYHPISNVAYLCKVTERAVVTQVQDHLTEHNLYAETQSAYRRHHSVETALVRLQNDILLSLDQRKEAILVLLDFSSAFDTIDHSILLSRLSQRFGFDDTVLKWIRSYLLGRSHVVKIGNSLSKPVDDVCGVPQGSVIGPLLYTLYVTPIEDIIRAHNLGAMLYADDTQVYTIFNCADRDIAITNMNKCLQDIRIWATRNRLTLNDSKTEVVHFTSKFPPRCNPVISICMGGKDISTSEVVRNLGVMMDQHLTMKAHVKKICRSAMVAIRKISNIRAYLSQQTAEMLIHAFVTSRLDSCNALLGNLPDVEIKRLQHIQNIAARIVTRTHKHERITPVLLQLHWLPVRYRIEFKILLMVYKILNGTAPSYISSLVNQYTPARSLRSADMNLLQTPRVRTEYYGDRAFGKLAPTLWNSLPLLLRDASSLYTFKKDLKTYMFNSIK